MMQLIARDFSLFIRRDKLKIQRQYACLNTITKHVTRCCGLRHILFLNCGNNNNNNNNYYYYYYYYA